LTKIGTVAFREKKTEKKVLNGIQFLTQTFNWVGSKSVSSSGQKKKEKTIKNPFKEFILNAGQILQIFTKVWVTIKAFIYNVEKCCLYIQHNMPTYVGMLPKVCLQFLLHICENLLDGARLTWWGHLKGY
jgi:hypothetical protein